MVIPSIFAGAFASMILEEIWDKTMNIITEKPATKVFEDSLQKLKDKKILESLNMKDFLKLCDRIEFPESRKIIESAYQNLGFTEPEKGQLFRDFKEIFPGEEDDLKTIFEEFLKIFLREVVKNSKDTQWKYWIWMKLKEKGERRILLESFEEALRFDVKKAKWFRGSPLWVDFEERKIFRRKEVDIIKEKLKKENIQIVYGDAASGKSVIVKYIGYEYCKKPKPVFMINLKTDSLEWYKDNIVDLLNRDGLLIIEDAHLAFHDVNWIVSKATGKQLRVLISTRPIEEKTIPWESTRFETLVKKKENFTEIKAFSAAEEIVRFYLSQKYDEISLKKSERIIKELAQGHGKDLWLLSFALESFSPRIGIYKNEIYENIHERYLKRIAVGKNKFVLDAYKYLYPICVFYQYEVSICKDFLLKNLGLNEIYLNQLVEAGEILQKENMVLLHHSSRAKYFFEAMIHHALCKEKDELELIHLYIQSFHEFACDVVAAISDYPHYRFDLVANLISDSNTLKGIVKGIDEAGNIRVIGKCLSGVSKINRNTAKKLVRSMKTEKIAGKTIKANDLWEVGGFLAKIGEINANVAKELTRKINIEILARKMEKTSDLEEIGYCFSEIIGSDKSTARQIATNVVINVEEADLWEVGGFLSEIGEINANVAKELTRKINIEILARKMEKTSDLEGVGYCFSEISKSNYDVAKELIPIIAKRINEASQGEIGDCFSEILRSGEGIARELLKKLVEITDLLRIECCFSEILRSHEDVARSLITIIAKRIDEDDDLEGIAHYFSEIGEINANVAKELTKKINIEILARKMERSSLEEAKFCLLAIEEINEEITDEILSLISSEKLITILSYSSKLAQELAIWRAIWHHRSKTAAV